MKKVIISESQYEKVLNYLNKLEKVREHIYKLFDEKFSPINGWQRVNRDISNSEKTTFTVGETTIASDDYFYHYYTCRAVEEWELDDTECPCLLLEDDGYYFFDNRFPPDLWKPLLVEWWNKRCEYRVKAVYKY